MVVVEHLDQVVPLVPQVVTLRLINLAHNQLYAMAVVVAVLDIMVVSLILVTPEHLVVLAVVLAVMVALITKAGREILRQELVRQEMMVLKLKIEVDSTLVAAVVVPVEQHNLTHHNRLAVMVEQE